MLVEPTTPEETLQILRNIKDKYEEHHNVTYTEEALEACVKLTERYITDRNFPDKAIDALDEAGSRVHLTNITVPKEMEEQEKLIDEARMHKTEAVRLQDFELAASFRDRERRLEDELEAMKCRWEESLRENREKVDEDQIADVVSMMSGVPVQRMAQAEGSKLRGMKRRLALESHRARQSGRNLGESHPAEPYRFERPEQAHRHFYVLRSGPVWVKPT